MTVSNLLQNKIKDNLEALGYSVTGSYEALPEQIVNSIAEAVKCPYKWPGMHDMDKALRVLVQNYAHSEFLVKVKDDGAYLCKLSIDKDTSLCFRMTTTNGSIRENISWFSIHDHPGFTGEVRRFFHLDHRLPDVAWEFIQENAYIITEVSKTDEYIRMWDHQSLMEDCRSGQCTGVSPLIWATLLEIERLILDMDYNDPCWVRYDKED